MRVLPSADGSSGSADRSRNSAARMQASGADTLSLDARWSLSRAAVAASGEDRTCGGDRREDSPTGRRSAGELALASVEVVIPEPGANHGVNASLGGLPSRAVATRHELAASPRRG
jgi:hypothetical protein